MVSKVLKVKIKSGLHMRPAMHFVKAMNKYSSAITIKHGGREVNGKSIISLMSACIKNGSEITVECSGGDEEEMLCEAKAMIEGGFYE